MSNKKIINFILISFIFLFIICNSQRAFSLDSNDVSWDENKTLGQNGPSEFAGIYNFDNLTIGDNVEITNNGISQLVLNVKGTLTIGKNVVIRVRNGCYSFSPLNLIASLNSDNLNSYGEDAGGFRVYENMFGKGGNGGDGGKNEVTSNVPGGGGGGGGYGGGAGGKDGGYYQTSYGQPYGGNGSNGWTKQTIYKGCGDGGTGGLTNNVGSTGGDGLNGYDAKTVGTGGGGGGGNGGDGGKGGSFINYIAHATYSLGAGGGGGGYGGGILTIIANKVIYDANNPPRFIVAGQKGGKGGSRNGRNDGPDEDGSDGGNGEGGLLIINSPDYYCNTNQWLLGYNIFQGTYYSINNGGHGTVTGDPQKVFINGDEVKYVSGLSLDKQSVTLKLGTNDSCQLSPQITPIDATYRKVIWISSDPNIATVDDNGLITPVSQGNATITATTAQDGPLSAYCNVTVVQPVTGIEIDKKDLTLLARAGVTANINASIKPFDATNKNLIWDSEDKTVATVDSNGHVVPVHPGDTDITVTTEDGGYKATCKVTVLPVKVEAITLNYNYYPLFTGLTKLNLAASLSPADATDQVVIWTSSDSDVAEVVNGEVNPKSQGTCTITAKTEDGGYTAKCVIEVKNSGPGDKLFTNTKVLLGPNGTEPFAGVYEYDNLILGDNVTLYSDGISQLVLKVNGTLVLGKNAVIRVRNGYCQDAPSTKISNLTSDFLNNNNSDGYNLYPDIFGRGGDGGPGGPGAPGTFYSIIYGVKDFMDQGGNGGQGGDGGFGGGKGGKGGAGAPDIVYIGGWEARAGSAGSQGSDNGGRLLSPGVSIGTEREQSIGYGSGGYSGEGNGGKGGAPAWSAYLSNGGGFGGGGGGGGGYGGGILTIVAGNIVYDPANPPRLLVSGQKGGKGYKVQGAGMVSDGLDGGDGEGGLLIINCNGYLPSPDQWNLYNNTFGVNDPDDNNGGHGIIAGNPQKVFINNQDMRSLPVAVTGITTTNTKSDEIDLTWNAIDGAVSYVIFQANSADGPYVVIGNSSSANYCNKNLKANTTYYYKVCAANINGTGPQSQSLAAATKEESSAFLAGDINGDNMVTSEDAAIMKNYLLEKPIDEAVILKNGDIDGDGTITSRDYALLLEIIKNE